MIVAPSPRREWPRNEIDRFVLAKLEAASMKPNETAEAVRRLEAAGYANVGKTNLHEFAYGITSANPHFGTVPGITAAQQAQVEWTHWNDAVNVYGRDPATGFGEDALSRGNAAAPSR